MTLLIVIVVLIFLFGGYSYYPRQGFTTPAVAPFGLGGLVLLLVILWALGVVRV